MANAAYYVMLGCCKAVGWLPYGVLYYVLAPTIYFVIYHVARYRIGVTRDNLHRCFPDRSRRELRRIERRYYRHLADVVVDTIDMASMSSREAATKFRIVNLDEYRDRINGHDWMMATSHYGSWEYFATIVLQYCHESNNFGIYAPLHNQVFDRYYRYIRSRYGMTPIPKKMILRHIISARKESDKQIVLGMIADQSPPFFEVNHWYDFLNRPTAFYWGVEKIAQRFNIPVLYFHIRKIGHSRYEGRFEQIYDGREPVAEFEITERYVRHLEEDIRRVPEYWMWSHRRWKHTPQGLGMFNLTPDDSGAGVGIDADCRTAQHDS